MPAAAVCGRRRHRTGRLEEQPSFGRSTSEPGAVAVRQAHGCRDQGSPAGHHVESINLEDRAVPRPRRAPSRRPTGLFIRPAGRSSDAAAADLVVDSAYDRLGIRDPIAALRPRIAVPGDFRRNSVLPRTISLGPARPLPAGSVPSRGRTPSNVGWGEVNRMGRYQTPQPLAEPVRRARAARPRALSDRVVEPPTAA